MGIGTHGFTSRFSQGKIRVSFEGYLQHQTQSKTPEFSGVIAMGKTWDKTTLTVGSDYLSSGFKPLFGTNHKFYGFMDYFYVGKSPPRQRFVQSLYSNGLLNECGVNSHYSDITSVPL